MESMAHIYADNLVQYALNIHGVCWAYRATNDPEYRDSARRHLPALKRALADLERDLYDPDDDESDDAP